MRALHRPALPELAVVILCAPTSGSALRAASRTTASMSPSGPGTRLQRHHARLHEGIRGRPVRPRLGSSTPGRHCRTPPSGGMSSLRLRALRRRRHHLTPGERSSEGRPPGGFSASVRGHCTRPSKRCHGEPPPGGLPERVEQRCLDVSRTRPSNVAAASSLRAACLRAFIGVFSAVSFAL